MRRRQFLSILGGAAAWPLAVSAQQGGHLRRIGVLMPYAESDQDGQAFIAAFREGLQKLGWVEGRNIRIDYRWAPPSDAKLRQDTPRNSSRCSPNSFLRRAHPPRRRSCNKHAQSPSYLLRLRPGR
jgi:putative ABC transport system substrate-binding protein